MKKKTKKKPTSCCPMLKITTNYPFHVFIHYELHADISQRQNNATFFEEKEMGAVGEIKQD